MSPFSSFILSSVLIIPPIFSFFPPFFEWANYSNLCKWVVSIFLLSRWKLKVTRRDPHLLLRLNCSVCVVWITVMVQACAKASLTRDMWPFPCTAPAVVRNNPSVMTPTTGFIKLRLNIPERTTAIMLTILFFCRGGGGGSHSTGQSFKGRFFFKEPFHL